MAITVLSNGPNSISIEYAAVNNSTNSEIHEAIDTFIRTKG